MNSYATRAAAGTLVRLSVTFTDVAGVPTDPGVVTCAVRRPDNQVVAPAPIVIRDAVGAYHADVDIAGWAGGVCAYAFSGTAPLEVTVDSTFNVRALDYSPRGGGGMPRNADASAALTPLVRAHLAEQHRARLARDGEVEGILARRYRGTLGPAQTALDELMARIARYTREHLGQAPPRAWVYEEGRLREVLTTLRSQAEHYARETQRLVQPLLLREATLGARDALGVLKTLQPTGLPGGGLNAGGAGWTWGRPSPGALTALARQPNDHLFARWGDRAADAVQQTLWSGIALGRHPTRVAEEMSQQVQDLTYSRAVTIARTSATRAYTDGGMATYRANRDVVDGWVWLTEEGPRTCGACLGMQGTEHPLDEDLYDHPNGRCSRVPKLRGYGAILSDFGIEAPEGAVAAGADIPPADGWLKGQPDHVVQAVLGPGKAGLYRRGEITLADLVGVQDDPLWGRSIYERPLKAVRALARPGAQTAQ